MKNVSNKKKLMQKHHRNGKTKRSYLKFLVVYADCDTWNMFSLLSIGKQTIEKEFSEFSWKSK